MLKVRWGYTLHFVKAVNDMQDIGDRTNTFFKKQGEKGMCKNIRKIN
ncbi:hypothetical protein [Enterocloster bolteae]|nr:hypothetical protein [Enterocloster bolteae]